MFGKKFKLMKNHIFFFCIILTISVSSQEIEKECINNSKLDPQDQLMVSRYIYPDLDVLNNKVGQS